MSRGRPNAGDATRCGKGLIRPARERSTCQASKHRRPDLGERAIARLTAQLLLRLREAAISRCRKRSEASADARGP